MKRIVLLLLTLLLLTACAGTADQPQPGNFVFYYPAKTIGHGEAGAFCTVQAEIDPESELEQVIRTYLAAPVPAEGSPAVPEDWILKAVRQEDQTAIMVFGGGVPTELQRSMACTALTRTLLQIPGIQRVSVMAPGREEAVVLAEGDVFLTDTGMLPQKETVVLYFPDSTGRYLVRETVTAEAMEAEEKPAYIMQQLLSSENSGQIRSCIPEKTRLLGVRVENGLCTVDLSSEFLQNDQTYGEERLAVYSIVNSLTELPEITAVDFFAAGSPVELLHRMDLSAGVQRDESLIASPGKDRIDVTLYPVCDSEGLLAATPMMVEIGEDQSPAEATMGALLAYESRNGMESCIPVGTKVLNLRMENTTCIVELTGEFLAGCPGAKEETIAVRSVIATLCALPEINYVEILVEGIAPRYRSSELSGLRQANPAWMTE